jgi:hypothetical protein
MPYIQSSMGMSFTQQYVPSSLCLQFGQREVAIRRDLRTRYYNVNPLIDCSVGLDAGHLEILLFRRWLITLSKAR